MDAVLKRPWQETYQQQYPQFSQNRALEPKPYLHARTRRVLADKFESTLTPSVDGGAVYVRACMYVCVRVYQYSHVQVRDLHLFQTFDVGWVDFVSVAVSFLGPGKVPNIFHIQTRNE